VLGVGAFGKVYLAIDTADHNKTVAVKTMPVESSKNELQILNHIAKNDPKDEQ
jgi:serine/threonine protein kinase